MPREPEAEASLSEALQSSVWRRFRRRQPEWLAAGGRSVRGPRSVVYIAGGGAGEDEIYGLEGRDFLLGGAGDDFIEAADGERDHIGCGPGNDVVSVDKKDLVAHDCETVYTS